MVAGIASHPERGWDFALARYNPDGSLDSTFSGDGRLTTDLDGGADAAHALALEPAAGSSWAVSRRETSPARPV